MVDEIRRQGRDADCFVGNVLEEGFPQRLIDNVLRKYGKINGLINNAGMLLWTGSLSLYKIVGLM